eukprot:3706645-Rhodomonas_salina.4
MLLAGGRGHGRREVGARDLRIRRKTRAILNARSICSPGSTTRYSSVPHTLIAAYASSVPHTDSSILSLSTTHHMLIAAYASSVPGIAQHARRGVVYWYLGYRPLGPPVHHTRSLRCTAPPPHTLTQYRASRRKGAAYAMAVPGIA